MMITVETLRMESMLGNLLGTLEPEFSLYSQVVEEEVKNLDPENPGNNVWRLLAIKREFDTLLEHISGYHRKEGELTMGKWQPPRRVLLVKIHIAATKMGLDEDTYRSLLYRYTAKTSAGDLSNAELSYVVTQIECDFGLRLEKPKGKTAGQIAKIKALLTAKGQRDGVYIPVSYAEAILKQQCGVEKLEWANSKQLQAVITALIIDGKRTER